MSAHRQHALHWRLNNSHAELNAGPWNLQIDLDDPAAGIRVARAGASHAGEARLLGVYCAGTRRSPGRIVDRYARDADLVVTYDAEADQPIRVQVYWSAARLALPEVEGLQLDLLVSVQTDRLDIAALVEAESQIANVDLWRGRGRQGNTADLSFEPVTGIATRIDGGASIPCVLAATEAAATGVPSPFPTYIEAAPPSDQLGAEVANQAGVATFRRRLLDEGMEKGVIRRVRVRGWLIDGRFNPEWARLLCQGLSTEKLPLTV